MTLPVGWRLARFEEVLSKVDRKFIIDDGAMYKCVGVRWYGHGAFVREQQLGAEIARKQQWTIQAGDVVYNKLFAWKGAFAIADDAVDGCIVSDKFPTYIVDTRQLDPAFLAYFFTTPRLALQAQDLSKGAAAISKLTLNPPQFWDLTIPLPPLPEQQRIVASIDALAGRVKEARQLRREAEREASILLQKGMNTAIAGTLQFRHLKELLSESLANGLSLSASQIGTEGIKFSKVGIVNTGKINPNETKRVNIALHPESQFWMRPGDIFVSRGNSLELVGRAAVYDGEPPELAFSDLLIRIRVKSDIVNPRFVAMYFHSQPGRTYIETQASGTSPSMKKVSQPKLEAMPIPLPTLEVQNQILANLDKLQMKVEVLRQLQMETQIELDALVPSILARAFAGEI